MQGLFGKTINLLSGMLDYRVERHKVLVSNITNMDTPGYKPMELVFKRTLEETTAEKSRMEMVRTNSRHFNAAQGKSGNFQITVSGEKVEIDKAMADLAENNLMHNFTVELLARKFNGLNTVLKETK
ncbi:MAG: flagellar basal body rod protein FlgB [Syntrophales bacterium]